MKDPQYKHYFTVTNGKFVFEQKDMFEYKKRLLEGKRGYAIIEGVEDKITPNQYAYYFGGIIRIECMNSNVFTGLTESEIHQIIFKELRSYNKSVEQPDGKTEIVTFTDDFSAYNKEDMRKYVEEVIPWLGETFKIYAKPPEHYKYNKYYMKTKVIREHDKI